MAVIKNFCKALLRRKPLEVDLSATRLNRCLSTLDLTALGIGSTLGLGIYVIAGQVASTKAGPAVTISFLIAAIASIFAGLCYAEFGARVPRAGSAYIYSYVTVGEFMAFIIGWNLILEYVIGTASVARGYSGYIDSLFDGTIQNHFMKVMPIRITNVSPYPDFLAFGITLVLTVMLAVGVKESSRFNNIFTGLNLLVVIFAIVAGSIKADIHNWKLTKEEIPPSAGEGGFMPFGVSGMMAGAATCFYAFIGFDCIATTGEEVKNPQKSIPISIVLSLLFVFLAYFGVSAVQTLMWPYYYQNNSAPLPYVFEMVGWPVARWIIAIGALAGLSTSLLGAMFPLPRVLYSMATDGIIFRSLAIVHPRFKTPLFATAVSGIFAGCMAMMFKVQELADMMSIGTLLAYTLVAVSVLIIRYRCYDNAVTTINHCEPKYSNIMEKPRKEESEDHTTEKSPAFSNPVELPFPQFTYNAAFRQIWNLDGLTTPTPLSSQISVVLILIVCALVIILDSLLALLEDQFVHKDIPTLCALSILTFLIIFLLFLLKRQPVDGAKISFKVPLVPFIPVISIWVNVYLMFQLSLLTWERFGVWMGIGFCVYFFYGLWHSSERSVCNGPGNVYVVENDGHLVNHIDSPHLGCNGPKTSIDSNIAELASSVPSYESEDRTVNSNHVTSNTHV